MPLIFMKPLIYTVSVAVVALVGAGVHLWLTRGSAILLDMSSSTGAC